MSGCVRVLGKGTGDAGVCGIWAGGQGPRGMEAGGRLGAVIVVVREKCTRSRGGREGIVGWGLHGVPGQRFSGVDCWKEGGSLNAG